MERPSEGRARKHERETESEMLAGKLKFMTTLLA